MTDTPYRSITEYKRQTRAHITGLHANVEEHKARADRAEVQVRSLSTENKILRTQVRELEAKLKSLGVPA